MNATTANSNETAILFVCNCCQHVAQARLQPALIAGRAPLIQIECKTDGCNNKDWTYTYRDGEDNSQATDLYTPVVMDAGQVERFVRAAQETAA